MLRKMARLAIPLVGFLAFTGFAQTPVQQKPTESLPPTPEQKEWQREWTKFVDEYDRGKKKLAEAEPKCKEGIPQMTFQEALRSPYFVKYSKCMDDAFDEITTFSDKQITWTGEFKSFDAARKVATVQMTPSITTRKGEMLCCAVVDIAETDFDGWKALVPRTTVTFTGILGKDAVYPVQNLARKGAVVGEGKVLSRKEP